MPSGQGARGCGSSARRRGGRRARASRGEAVEHGGEGLLGEVVRGVDEARGRRRRTGAGSWARCRGDGRAHDAGAGRDRGARVRGDDVGGAAVGLDEHDRGGAAAGGLETQGAGTGVEVEHARPAHGVAGVEGGNTASRTRSLVGRVPEPGGVRTVRPPATPAMIRVTSAPLQVGGLLGVDPGAHRRGEVGVRGQLRVVGDEGEGVLAGLLDDVLVVEDVQELELGAPAVLGRAEDVALPALGEVEPGELEAVGGGGDGRRAGSSRARRRCR